MIKDATESELVQAAFSLGMLTGVLVIRLLDWVFSLVERLIKRMRG